MAIEVSRPTDDLVFTDEPHHSPTKYQAVGPVEQHVAALRELHVADKKGERSKTVLSSLMGAAGLGTVISIFAAGAFEAWWGFLVAGGLAVSLIVLGVLRWKLGGADVDDRKLHAARRPLEVLGPEIRNARGVAAWIDFGGYHKTKAVKEPDGRKVYTKPEWLRLRFSLLDGTAVRLSATTTAKRKTKAKRKYTKLKDKVVDELVIQLKAPRGRELNGASAESLKARFKPRGGLTLVGCRIKPRIVELKFRAGVGLRVKGRYGWEGRNLEKLLDGEKILEAIIYAYNATAVAAAPRAA